jgi:septal ring factor EnvC (AmiA/AmiB activator)
MSSGSAVATVPHKDAADTKSALKTGAKDTATRSKARLRELGAEVDKMQDRLSDLDEEIKDWNAAAAARRKNLKTQIAATIKVWNEEAAKRK